MEQRKLTLEQLRAESELLWGHIPIPINKDGEGPLLDNDPNVDRIICWICYPEEDWPCKRSIELRENE